jgi:hypothetical protein
MWLPVHRHVFADLAAMMTVMRKSELRVVHRSKSRASRRLQWPLRLLSFTLVS